MTDLTTYVVVSGDVGSTLKVTLGVPVALPGTSVLTLGVTGNGVTDDTTAIRNACLSGKVLNFPKTSSFYKITGIIDLTNSVYSNGAEIRVLQDGTGNTSIFRVIQNPSQLTIDGFVLNGLFVSGTAGEYSMGIDLRSVNKVIISDNTIQNMYGDCIYIGEQSATIPCTNVTIDNNTLLNPRRNNVTLVLADGIIISNNTIKKTIDYVHGIDIEPNAGTDYVKNVTISGNNIDSPSQCINSYCQNAVFNTGMIVKNNVATGIEFFYGDRGLSGPSFTGNTFLCKDPARGGNEAAGMFYIGNTSSGTVSGNIDNTACGGTYRSLTQWSSTLTVSNNTFC